LERDFAESLKNPAPEWQARYIINMNIFKPITLKWWQVGLLKFSVLALGILLGAVWPGVFAPALPVLVVLFVIPAVYLIRVWWRQ
jgi:hypothetical protein